MLTLDMLYAVLQGLPPSYLTYLDAPLAYFCGRIHAALNNGHDPISALNLALKNSGPSAIQNIKKIFAQTKPVMHIPGLTFAQRQVLVALRYAKVASLSQLSHALVMDRANTNRRLIALAKKGLVLKFYSKGGAYYLPIPAPLDKKVKREVYRLINDQLKAAQPTTSTTSTIP